MKNVCLFFIVSFVISAKAVSERVDTIQRAALAGDMKKVEKFINHGADVDSRDKKGWVPLHYACAAGHIPVVKYLLEKRATVDARDSTREAPLHKACQWGRQDVVRLLLKHGASVDVQDNRGETPLHQAGDAQTAHILIEHSADINKRDYRGRTALHHASINGRKDVVDELVKAGADLTIRDSQGKSAIDVAGKNENNSKNAHELKTYLKREQNLAQQLHKASASGNVRAMSKLIKQGAPINVPDRNGNTPLHLAVKSGNSNAVAYLLTHEPDLRLRVQNNDGLMALELAARNPEMLKIFKRKLRIENSSE